MFYHFLIFFGGAGTVLDSKSWSKQQKLDIQCGVHSHVYVCIDLLRCLGFGWFTMDLTISQLLWKFDSEPLGTMMFQGMWSCDPLISTTRFIPNGDASKPVTLWYGMVWFYILNYFDILDEHPFDIYFDVNQVIASAFIMFDPHPNPNRAVDHQATIFSTLPSKESSRLIGVRIKIYGAKLVW